MVSVNISTGINGIAVYLLNQNPRNIASTVTMATLMIRSIIPTMIPAVVLPEDDVVDGDVGTKNC